MGSRYGSQGGCPWGQVLGTGSHGRTSGVYWSMSIGHHRGWQQAASHPVVGGGRGIVVTITFTNGGKGKPWGSDAEGRRGSGPRRRGKINPSIVSWRGDRWSCCRGVHVHQSLKIESNNIVVQQIHQNKQCKKRLVPQKLRFSTKMADDGRTPPPRQKRFLPLLLLLEFCTFFFAAFSGRLLY